MSVVALMRTSQARAVRITLVKAFMALRHQTVEADNQKKELKKSTWGRPVKITGRRSA